MRVLEVFGEPIIYGGQESFVLNFISHMDRESMQIDVLTPYYCDNEVFRKKITGFGGKVYSLGCDFKPGKSRLNIYSKISGFLEENLYDVVHIHSGSTSVLAIVSYLAKKNGAKKVLVHSHCGIEKVTFKNIIIRRIGNIFMKHNVDEYLACSLVAGEARYVPTVTKDKLIIMNNGVDLNKFSYNPTKRKNIRSHLDINENELVLGHVGRFSYQKNHDFLIDIFYDYLKRNDNAKLLLIGDGELKEDIEKKVNDLKINNKVIFTGLVDNVEDYLQAMDVFVLPSRFEGLPIVGVEAQASGLPLLVSDKVSSELKITSNIKYLPINQGSGIWVDGLVSYQSFNRVKTDAIIKNNGYDINDTAKKIREIYLRVD